MLINNWQDYVQSTQLTATYPDAGVGTAIELAYLTLGLIGELGELKEASIVDSKLSTLLAEAGDCYWYIGRLDHVFVVPFYEEPAMLVGLTDPLNSALTVSARIANATKKCLRDSAHHEAAITHISLVKQLLDVFVDSIMPVDGDFEERLVTHVLRPNLAKLLDRQSRGVIKGSGDYR